MKPVARMPTSRLTSTGTRTLSVTASASASVTAPRRPPQRIAVPVGPLDMVAKARSMVSSGSRPKRMASRAPRCAARIDHPDQQKVAEAHILQQPRDQQCAARMKMSAPAQCARRFQTSPRLVHACGGKRPGADKVERQARDATTAMTPDAPTICSAADIREIG